MENKELSEFYFNNDAFKKKLENIDTNLFNSGKKFRTKLIEFIAESYDMSIYQIAPYARVIELVHNATLIHDDVLDESSIRRGCETLSAKLGNKASVLSGDYMLAKALHELSGFAPSRIISELTLTLKDIVEGELLQSSENENYIWTFKSYNLIAQKKTGSLFRWCLSTPAILAKETEVNIKKLEELSMLLGVFYQIYDDILDFDTLSKKTPFLDISNWNINYVLILVQEESQDLSDYLRLNKGIDRLTAKDRSLISGCVQMSIAKLEELQLKISDLALDIGRDSLTTNLSNLILSKVLKLKNKDNFFNRSH